MHRTMLGLAAILLGAGCGDDSSALDSPECTAYLECLKEAAAKTGQQAAYDQAAMLYGSSSACGQSDATKQQCEQSCKQGLAAAKQSGLSCSGGADGGVKSDGGGTKIAAAFSCDTKSSGGQRVCYDDSFAAVTSDVLASAQAGCTASGGTVGTACDRGTSIGGCRYSTDYMGFTEDVTQWFYTGNASSLQAGCKGTWTLP